MKSKIGLRRPYWAITGVFAAFAVLVMPKALEAQEEPNQLFACYVPSSGITYRVNPPTAPNEDPKLRDRCSGRRHVSFSWTDAEGADHGALTGLEDDDHPQYLLIDGSRALTGDVDADGNKVTGLGAPGAMGDAVRYDEAVLDGDATGGDLAGTFPDPTVTGLRGNPIDATVPTDGQLLGWDETASSWKPMTAEMVISDHSNLTGLTDDDHPQYLPIDGSRALTGDLDADGNRVSGLAAPGAMGDAVRYDEAVLDGDAAGGDLAGTFPAPTVTGLRGNPIDATAPTDGQLLGWDAASSSWKPVTAAAPAPGLSGFEVFETETACGDPLIIQFCGFSIQCPRVGQVALSGGWDWDNTSLEPVRWDLKESRPGVTPDRWFVSIRVHRQQTMQARGTMRVHCAFS